MYLQEENQIWMGYNGQRVCMSPKMCNRHGLIAGATGTGKTVTLKVMAESFSDMGVPVFLADIKGDLSGLCRAGEESESLKKRLDKLGLTDFTYSEYPVHYFDVFGKKGHPVRATVSDIGPDLLSRLLDLNPTQAGILTIVFRIADDNGWLLLDLKDLKSMVRYVGDNAADFRAEYGNIAAASVGAIQRALIRLEEEGAELFLGEPDLDIFDWMAVDGKSRGYINVLNCVELYQSPLLYSTFLLWMLAEVYEQLPEAGDLEKPRMIFFFDEAHLLFDDMPKILLQKIEQMVKLIRSKGVGIYFVTQVPTDIPDSVLSQLGNKVQHALRAYTPKDQKAVRAAAQSFRENPAFDTEEVLGELGTGEALMSFLDEEGVPGVVQRAFVLPPRSFMGVASDQEIRSQIENSPLYLKYDRVIDRESAYEMLNEKALNDAEEAELNRQRELLEKERAQAEKEAKREQEKQEKEAKREQERLEKQALREQEKREQAALREEEKKKKQKTAAVERAVGNVTASVGRSVAREAGKSIGKELDKKAGGGSFFSRMLGNAASSAGGSLARGLLGNLLR